MKWFRRKSVPDPPVNEPATTPHLEAIREKFAYFYALLESNNQVLRIIGDMEEKSQGEYLFDLNYIRQSLSDLRPLVNQIIDCMIALGGPSYETLRRRFELIDREIDVVLPSNRPLRPDAYTRPFDELNRSHSYSVGSKNAQLGEMKSKLGLPVPDGFAITAWSYRRFVSANDLEERIARRIRSVDLRSPRQLERISNQIQRIIRTSKVPYDQVMAIEEAAAELARQTGADRFSMRSSAIGEDTMFSFAGQYASYLNVPSNKLIQYYREVLASKFTPKAIYYFLSHALSEAELAMSVGCVTMIDAKAAGVAYTRCPVDPADDRIVVSSVWGLGKYLVDGTITPDIFRLPRQTLEVEETDISLKPIQLTLAPDGGTMEQPVPVEDQRRASLNDQQLRQLAEYAIVLEKHYGTPQDIEWVVDQEDRLLLLQTRPLQIVAAKADAELPDLDGVPIVAEGGTTVCHGAGAGPVHHVSQPGDLPGVPDGCVLVAPHPFPGLITVMGRISALLTQVGSMASHMATIAREYRIPTIVGLEQADHIPTRQVVTVDATGSRIYEGEQAHLVAARRPEFELVDSGSIYDLLGRVLDLVSPLRLLHPDDEDFVAENCVTYHDITRFAHQRATEEMFLGALSLEDKDRISLRLKSELPLTINVIYVDRDHKAAGGGGWVEVKDLHSEPIREFWDGIMVEGWPQAKAYRRFKPIGLIAGKEGRTGAKLDYSENSFAVLSREYMILCLRMGYHLATVEAMSSADISKNYIRMQFNYGGATLDRRKRRILLIKRILEAMGFACQRRADFISATVSYKSADGINSRLRRLGRLTIMTKQLDMALSSDRVAEWYTNDFLKKLGLAKPAAPENQEDDS